MNLVDCEHMDCQGRDKNKRITRPVWQGAADVLEEYFSKITLDDLLQKALKMEEKGTVSYSI